MIQTMVIELLGAVCLLPPRGHGLVAEGFKYFAEVKGESHRYMKVLAPLRLADNLEYMVRRGVTTILY